MCLLIVCICRDEDYVVNFPEHQDLYFINEICSYHKFSHSSTYSTEISHRKYWPSSPKKSARKAKLKRTLFESSWSRSQVKLGKK